MKSFWKLPVLTIYLYAITILAQFGFNNYFGIPYNFVEGSVITNTIYVYTLVQLAIGVFASMGFWGWFDFLVILIFAFAVIVMLFNRPGRVISGFAALIAIAFLWGSVSFGQLIAKTEPSFYVVPTDCLSNVVASTTYIVPNFYEGKAIVVPVDENKKIEGSFFLQDISSPACQLSKRYSVGPIAK